ncbi:unnamed protein product, partial [Musa acuminata var. zebrina]
GGQRGISAQFAGSVPRRRECGLRGAAVAGSEAGTAVAAVAGDGEVIGKVDEIFGPINEAYFWIKMLEGIIATWYLPSDKLYIDSPKLLPLTRFLPKPKYDNSSLFSFCCLLTTTLLSQHDNVAMISWYAAFHELNVEFYFIV